MGRSSVTGSGQSDYDRPETIEETAELVTRLGGTGIAIQVDHLDSGQVRRLAERVRDDYGGIDVLVNDIWGAEVLKGPPARWNTPIWEHGVTEGNWRDALDPNKVEGHPSALEGFVSSESPRYVGRAVASMASDPKRARWNQRSVTSAELAHEYGFTRHRRIPTGQPAEALTKLPANPPRIDPQSAAKRVAPNLLTAMGSQLLTRVASLKSPLPAAPVEGPRLSGVGATMVS